MKLKMWKTVTEALLLFLIINCITGIVITQCAWFTLTKMYVMYFPFHINVLK